MVTTDEGYLCSREACGNPSLLRACKRRVGATLLCAFLKDAKAEVSPATSHEGCTPLHATACSGADGRALAPAPEPSRAFLSSSERRQTHIKLKADPSRGLSDP